MEALEQRVAEAVAGSLFDKMSSGIQEELIDIARQRFLEQFKVEAVELAKAELQGTYAELEVRLRDRVARREATMRLDLEKVSDETLKKERETMQAEQADLVDSIRQQRSTARLARDLAEACVVYVVRGLFPPPDEHGEPRWLYLWDYGFRSWDSALVNPVLAKHKLRIRSRAVNGSERQVQTRLSDGRIEPRAKFALETVAGDPELNEKEDD